jgi:hypothetical protein
LTYVPEEKTHIFGYLTRVRVLAKVISVWANGKINKIKNSYVR